ncbi:MAG: hypothetical protein R3F61_01045 [Myxococcota bacterium]
MYWIVWTLQRTWRSVLWSEGHRVLEPMAEWLDAAIVPSRAGWELQGARGRLRVRGGLRGTRTELWRADGTYQVVPGWLEPGDMQRFLAGEVA